MHIVLGLLAILGGAAFWWWRLKMMGEAANDVNNAVGRVVGNYKRKKFLKKAGESPLASITDPAAAAVVMMFAVAKEEMPLNDAVEKIVQDEVTNTMKITDSTELMVFSKWVVSHVADANNVSLRCGKLWMTALSVAEREDFVAMIERVAKNCGGLTTNQENKIKKLRERLGFQVT